MLDRLTIEDFADLRGQALPLRAADGATEATIVDVRALASPSPRAGAPFTLLLRTPASFRGPQGIYRLDHPRHGALDLFLVPVAADAGTVTYEAVFN